jgi:hypothetical protein
MTASLATHAGRCPGEKHCGIRHSKLNSCLDSLLALVWMSGRRGRAGTAFLKVDKVECRHVHCSGAADRSCQHAFEFSVWRMSVRFRCDCRTAGARPGRDAASSLLSRTRSPCWHGGPLPLAERLGCECQTLFRGW